MTVAANVNQCVATIKSMEAQLSILAINSLDEEARRIFHEMMLMMDEIKKDLQARVTEIELEEPQYKTN
ncbi:DUF1657 domain-containing protein [Bacillus sp. CGMCC 1.16607]|uniref:DUF1657 domain-containing protein n=1 Tax=Bacillus sp. CGMCC 1.16607 TaxID=3351842 RepID=UPI00363CD036